MALKTLKSGQISGYPEYASTALTSFFGLEPEEVPSDAQAAYEKAKAEFEKEGLTAFPPTPFASANAVGTLKKTADEMGLETISDLEGQSEDLTLYGSPECRQRIDCLAGLEKLYGLKFKSFKPVDIGLRYTVLEKGQADLSILFTTDPQLAAERDKFVILEDDKEVFPAGNVLFVTNRRGRRRSGARLRRDDRPGPGRPDAARSCRSSTPGSNSKNRRAKEAAAAYLKRPATPARTADRLRWPSPPRVGRRGRPRRRDAGDSGQQQGDARVVGLREPADQGAADRRRAEEDDRVERHHPAAHLGRDGELQGRVDRRREGDGGGAEQPASIGSSSARVGIAAESRREDAEGEGAGGDQARAGPAVGAVDEGAGDRADRHRRDQRAVGGGAAVEAELRQQRQDHLEVEAERPDQRHQRQRHRQLGGARGRSAGPARIAPRLAGRDRRRCAGRAGPSPRGRRSSPRR